MRHKRQGPSWWKFWLALLLAGGLLVLERQAPLSPRGHQVVQLLIAFLMYGIVMCWLCYSRGALVHKAHEREQTEERLRQARRQRRVPAGRDDEPWDDARPPWQNNGHYTSIQRR